MAERRLYQTGAKGNFFGGAAYLIDAWAFRPWRQKSEGVRMEEMKRKSARPLTRSDARILVGSLRRTIERRLGGRDRRIDGLDQRMDGLDRRMDGLDQRMDGLDRRMDGLDQRMDGLDQRMDGLDQRMDGLDRRMDGLDRKIDYVHKSLAVEIVKTQGELREVRENMATKDDVRRILGSIEAFARRSESFERAMILHGRALTELTATTQDHGRRLGALESGSGR